MDLSKLLTEQRNENSMNLDQLNTYEILQTIHREDQKVEKAVSDVIPSINEVVENVYKRLARGGRLLYVGAGTSGRLGFLDSSECPPTFMTPPEKVQTLMAGGINAFFQAVEGSEDNEEQGIKDITEKGVNEDDVVIGITASGRTPYPIGALKAARKTKAYTVSLTCNKNSLISEYADQSIEVVVGPEVLTGSTRMKAATAHKMVLNMISTTTMIKLGKVYENLMVDVQASNYKLKNRARRIIMEITNVSYEEADQALAATKNEVKPAIVMIKSGVTYEEAQKSILKCNGYVREAINYAKQLS
ncbi:N-acetylmuramic acid 6-phosphate etherase [Alkalibacillus haloalkaliphilus]|uniref:N-acetylmuramic acid 6-phosphate etherase n=1 Tax=Alkalibacillus haloalkaliphilus TaxID=94136 RepID=UPI0029367309|nr:N-acetylmuramic acid 6-phosphate etherase [Alkalibacillus haloalkaliphilus]MDV2582407.1 N-acetylmuramic acid 6-phosphate etherase [Alkalibacillus haloalkaliphilus]